MSFSDIFKKSFLEGFQGGNITVGRVAVTLIVTAIIGMYIFLVYYASTKKSFYQKSFNISLVLVAVITSAIVLAMQSNLVISLGMVGALSIVRFRTAIKDPTDLVFLFWAISVGIICGADLYFIAIITSLAVTAGLFVLSLTPVGTAASLIIISLNSTTKEEDILNAVKEHSRVCKVRSRTVTGEDKRMIVECKPEREEELVKKINDVNGVFGVTLMEHNGEVTL
ncbi:MAG TPA: DUF4956 domain-containing protein [Lachnospiraceae bacterium]|nr:DUF4956 domain-containing protein [Lachnospiraceae bacterium]